MNIFEPLWGPPIRWVAKLTGRPSWWYAVPAVWIGQIVDGAGDLMYALTDNLAGGLIGVFATLLVASIVIPGVQRAADDARQCPQISGTIIRSLANESLGIWRLLGTVILAIDFSLVVGYVFNGTNGYSVFRTIGWLLTNYALWAVYFNEPGGKSVYARVKERVTALVKKTIPDLTPVPVPT